MNKKMVNLLKFILAFYQFLIVYEEVFQPLITRAARTQGSTDTYGCPGVALG